MGSEASDTDDSQYASLNVDIPDPPADLSYARYADYEKRELLRVNGISLDEVDVLGVLRNGRNVLQAAAAHVAGELGYSAAVPILQGLLTDWNDFVKVEAAYALARLGDPSGRNGLIQCLKLPLDAYLSPEIAAGYLAQLGDSRGFGTVVRAFDVANGAVRMLACKQLFFFVPFDGRPDEDGSPIDVFRQFDRALRDADSSIQWQALVQLRELRSPRARPILEAYLGHAPDEQSRQIAQGILG